MSRAQQQGFSLLELILVITLIGLLAAWSIRYYNDVAENSQRVGMEALANHFATAVMGVHGQWLLHTEARGPASQLENDGVLLAISKTGWPIGVVSGGMNTPASAYQGTQDQQQCAALWMNLLHNPAPYVLAGDEESRGFRYRISALTAGGCRFELISSSLRGIHFDYFVRNGQVILSRP